MNKMTKTDLQVLGVGSGYQPSRDGAGSSTFHLLREIMDVRPRKNTQAWSSEAKNAAEALPKRNAPADNMMGVAWHIALVHVVYI